MVWRKILWNIIAAFVLFPIVGIGRHWVNIITGNYEYYNIHYTLREYLGLLLYGQVYFSIFWLLIVLFPFQLIKDYRYRIGKRLSFLYKVLVFAGIISSVILIAGSFFVNIWGTPWWDNLLYIIVAIGISIIFTPFLYLTIDKSVERKPVNKTLSEDINEKHLLYIFAFIIVAIIILFHSS
ncbi:hypothetical protein KRE47_08730 [Elizabethkingia meningoseptica]|uniref:hypothetical protein n=1 Tax=Elizabethkingia meningoseptica TaxID=238 RepID=UPI0008413DB9|nr:hypothetical protein [Elizabethkingia meningoseptica]EJK5329764.1 hypothetical protein [Elizabethkingia meningoseptica]MDE5469123.1 hypothetical protein [Elizabethkingia meningoseptica]MDE5475037.1 hypothetical protein [Elizabethkingia meningoseptica]MDE5478470.1 hypothetical protein [Elizabethkingia meningoseptica]MDE5486164.1 hypothetical protein [Elizabethkingia meningoseptica]